MSQSTTVTRESPSAKAHLSPPNSTPVKTESKGDTASEESQLTLEEELYLERLSNEEMLERVNGGSDIGISINGAVDKFIVYYTGIEKWYFLKYWARGRRYLPLVKKILREEGIPQDLAYLPILESGYWATARSESKAVGYWQFIASTARIYGLKINHWVDERMDIELSTRAAARYLSDLYQRLNSWELAIAAYNAGPVTIEKAIEKAKSRNFWVLARSRDLKRETKEYVPRFMAILLLVHHPELYGLPALDPVALTTYEKVQIKEMIDLKKLCTLSGVSYKELKRLNPALKTEFTPPLSRYILKVPADCREKITKILMTPRYESLIKPLKVKGTRLLEYRVKRGDSPYKISRRFGIPLSTVIAINGIKNPRRIRPGSYLYIPVLPTKVARSKKRPATIRVGCRSYTVEAGDSLWSIARRFSVKVKELKRENRLEHSLIHPGDTIFIPRRTEKRGMLFHRECITYRVKKGDNLWKIANAFSVKVEDLKRWNGLKENLLHPGRELVIYASEKGGKAQNSDRKGG